MPEENTPTPAIQAEVNLGAIAGNVRAIKKILSRDCRFMAVVKAGGYGHGAFMVAETAIQNGATHIGVARIEEAAELREKGIAAPILILGDTPENGFDLLLRHKLAQTVFSVSQARSLSDFGTSCSSKIPVHVKIDTGMGRLGLYHQNMDSLIREVKEIFLLPGIYPEGIMTHFACADQRDKNPVNEQMDRFSGILAELEKAGMHFPVRHCANSAAIMGVPESHLDLVRCGISMYGLYPSHEMDRSLIDLQPAMTLKSRIIQIKSVPKGFPVSYGHTYTTDAPSRLATIAAGYADGLNRGLSNKGNVMVCGKKAPLVGRVCMDLTMIDITRIPEAREGDEVVIFGGREGNRIPVEELADLLNTINYEIVTSVSGRVPRCYYGG